MGRLRSAVRGLTLIELIVVMAIMTMIASGIVVAMLSGVKIGQETGTEAFFDAVKTQLGQYRDVHRMYLPSDDDNSSLPVWRALEYKGAFAAKKDFVERFDVFTDPETNATVPRFRYVDGWKKPIEYKCPPPFSRFELRSAGRDLEMNTADDIVATD